MQASTYQAVLRKRVFWGHPEALALYARRQSAIAANQIVPADLCTTVGWLLTDGTKGTGTGAHAGSEVPAIVGRAVSGPAQACARRVNLERLPMHESPPSVAIIGGGPAGLMAAEVLGSAGIAVDLYDAMPSVGRKFLLAGKGGLNLTHGEDLEAFAARYGERRAQVEPWLRAFGPEAVRAWALGLGIETFVGSSGRVFPVEKKAAPLLRAWLRRLRALGVRLHARHRWLGWATDDATASTRRAPGAGAEHVAQVLRFATPDGEREAMHAAVILALGGGSWARLGSDGGWVTMLAAHGIPIAPLRAANCGFDAQWSEHLRAQHAGAPLKSIALSFAGHTRRGECVVSAHGLEGSLIYAYSAALRDAIERDGRAMPTLDLLPDHGLERVRAEVTRPRGARSVASHLRSRLGLQGVKTALLREVLGADGMHDPERLAAAIKALPITLVAPRPLDEAISSAGGIVFDALDDGLMLRALPGVFCAGEMLDWEAPTGGYLLTACLASGAVAGRGCAQWIAKQPLR